MSTAEPKTRYAPEDLLAMPDGDRFELVDGNLVERNMGARSSFVAGEIYAILREYSRPRRLGRVFPEGTTYQCFPDAPEKVRKPDVSFIRRGRLPREQPPEGHVRIAPDLAVEVVSPNDLAYEIDQKVDEFVRAGVSLIWVVNPVTRMVGTYRRSGPGANLRENDELNGEDVLPGFRCRVADLFLSLDDTETDAAEQPPERNGGGTASKRQE